MLLQTILCHGLPNQSQESFFEGHVRAFDFLGGVPRQLVYDNLKTAVNKVLQGGDREEQVSFVAFRSHLSVRESLLHTSSGT